MLANREVKGGEHATRTVKIATTIQRVASREVEGVVQAHGREDEQEGGENPLSRWEELSETVIEE